MIRGVRTTACVVGMLVIVADLLFATAAYVGRHICDQSTCSGDTFWPVLTPLTPGLLLIAAARW